MSDMDKRKIKIGLIGFGSWVRRAHLPALEYDGRAIITAAAAATEKQGRKSRPDAGRGDQAVWKLRGASGKIRYGCSYDSCPG